jgi:glycosyltransferase involved in cell wall biosynthesis
MTEPLSSPEPTPLISVVVPTWNRSALLEGALDALVRQQDAPPHEIIVINNASRDGTRELALRYVHAYPQVRYLEEHRAGSSYARNAGYAAARGDLIAFTDDDVRVAPDWLRTIADAAEQYPDAGYIGGPVLPEWRGAVPHWLTHAHWSPLGIQEYDTTPFRVDLSRPVCLITANLTLRRRTVDAVGPFDLVVQRIGNGIGSTEDHQYHVRVWDAGIHGVYHPRVSVTAVVTAERLAKSYHRAWHFGHGKHLSRMRLPELESSRWHMADVPVHFLRQAATDVVRLIAAALRLDVAASFAAEVRLWFVAGFVFERLKAMHATPPSTTGADVVASQWR